MAVVIREFCRTPPSLDGAVLCRTRGPFVPGLCRPSCQNSSAGTLKIELAPPPVRGSAQSCKEATESLFVLEVQRNCISKQKLKRNYTQVAI